MLKVRAIGDSVSPQWLQIAGDSVTEYDVYLSDSEAELSHVGTVRQQKNGDWRAYADDAGSVDEYGDLTSRIGVFSSMSDAVAAINTFYDFDDGVCRWKYI